MELDGALSMMSELLRTAFWISLPLLGVTMAVGLMVSILQVVTQIQEPSLSFVPKLLAAGCGAVAFGPWMLRRLVSATTGLWLQIPQMF